MPAPILDTCSSGCGWIAAVCCACSYGSFGVPIKLASGGSNTDAGCFNFCVPRLDNAFVDEKGDAKKLEVSALTLQSYKTLVCFVTSWLVPLLLGEEVKWSSWGLLSGLFWVPGAICGIYGIRNAGMAIAVGTWSSMNVLISVVFGMIIFQEEVNDYTQTCCAFMLLIVGLIGMSRYSAATATSQPLSKEQLKEAKKQELDAKQQQKPLIDAQQELDTIQQSSQNGTGAVTPHNDKTLDSSSSFQEQTTPQHLHAAGVLRGRENATVTPSRTTSDDELDPTKSIMPMEIEPLLNHVEEGTSTTSTRSKAIRPGHLKKQTKNTPSAPNSGNSFDKDILKKKYAAGDDITTQHKNKDPLIIFFGGRIAFTKRQSGIMGAFINGAWGGLNLIPFHYARRDDPTLTPAGYLISFASGSLFVNTIIWLLVVLVTIHKKQWNMQDTMAALPKFHCSFIGIPGIIAGLLYSFGNFTAILAIAFLGQGIGGSFIQIQILVSGLWGVFFFREVRGNESIIKWFLSAVTAVTAIIWLSYQHSAPPTPLSHPDTLEDTFQ